MVKQPTEEQVLGKIKIAIDLQLRLDAYHLLLSAPTNSEQNAHLGFYRDANLMYLKTQLRTPWAM
jgi:hypothetical protein